MIIIGAGMAGLLAGSILRGFRPKIMEKQHTIPDNHGAVLRFKTQDVSWATGIPFRKVNVTKGIVHNGEVTNEATIWSSNRYSIKATGSVIERSIMDLSPCIRYIAPPEFATQMSIGSLLLLGQDITRVELNDFIKEKEPIISTIPLHIMWRMMGGEADPDDFMYRSITVITATISKPDCDVFQTLYYPDPYIGVYRASITGNNLIIELTGAPHNVWSDGATEKIISEVLRNFGLASGTITTNINVKEQKYGKISTPAPGKIRQMIYALTESYGIYSLGRFACWKHVTMDDLIHDISFIRDMIHTKSRYTATKRTMGGI